MTDEVNDYDPDDYFTKPKRAYCIMERNPVFPTSNPYGWVQLF